MLGYPNWGFLKDPECLFALNQAPWSIPTARKNGHCVLEVLEMVLDGTPFYPSFLQPAPPYQAEQLPFTKTFVPAPGFELVHKGEPMVFGLNRDDCGLAYSVPFEEQDQSWAVRKVLENA